MSANKDANSISAEFLKKLQHCVSNDSFFSDPSDCYAYGYDNSRQHQLPHAVVLPSDTEQIQQIVQLCNEYKIALTTRGRGTGTAGGSVPLRQGVVLSTENMAKIINIDPVNRVATVQPGVLNQTLQDALVEHKLFWAPDPTSAAFCSIGGNLAVNSAGPRAVKYGTTRDNVLGLSAITGSGDLIKAGVTTTKGVVGYDLTRLIIGSEGTLAVISEATLKLLPLPETKSTLQVFYKDIESATHAITKVMSQPITPCALEFIDSACLDIIRKHSPDVILPESAKALLMIDVDGDNETIKAASNKISHSLKNDGLIELNIAESKQDIEKIWKTRKALSPALRTIAPKKINEDVVVPVSEIPNLIKQLKVISDKYSIPIVNFGHAGNGNIHTNLLLDETNTLQANNAQACLSEVFELVLELNGTISGEHGVGMEKRDYVGREIDNTTLNLMRQIKTQFDPNNILNPDKMFPLVKSSSSTG